MPPRIVRCRAADAQRLTAIAHAAKRYWGYAERQLVRWRAELTVTPQQVERDEIWAADFGAGAIGFYALAFDGDVPELQHLWIEPAHIGDGLGRVLLAHAAAQARQRGAARIGISSDPHAEGFYLRCGARRVGSVPAPLDDEPERCLPRLVLELKTD